MKHLTWGFIYWTTTVKETTNFILFTSHKITKNNNRCALDLKLIKFSVKTKTDAYPLSATPTKWSNTRIVWVCLTIFWGWRLRGNMLFLYWFSYTSTFIQIKSEVKGEGSSLLIPSTNMTWLLATGHVLELTETEAKRFST